MDLWNDRRQHLGEWPKASLPAALLPLRLEARFEGSETTPLLKVRAYPDDLHLDGHEEELTDQERTWGTHYWETRWGAGDDAELEKAAWVQLADRFGAARAAWVRRALTPENLDALGTGEAPSFPNVAHRADSWTRPALGRALPDRLAVLGYRDGRRVLCAFGGPIPDPLPVGPNPSGEPPQVGDDQLPVDPGLEWLVDFAAAESVGMAVTASITATDYAEGFDTLLVLGLRSRDGGGEALESLLNAQHYTEGLAFVPQGTPSNNTAAAPSGYRSRDRGQERSHRMEAGEALTKHGDGSNGEVTATALGLRPGVFEHLESAQLCEQADARHMQGALWQVTWGYYLEQITGEDISDEALASLRAHYIDHVRARGPLPALRVARQPYGLLPVLPIKKAMFNNPDENRDERLAILLRAHETWLNAATQVPRLVRGTDASQLGEQLLKVLALGAVSSSYQGRPQVPVEVFGDSAIEGFEGQVPQSQQNLMGTASAAMEEVAGTSPAQPAQMLPLDRTFPLDMPLVQEGPLSDEDPLFPNYIEEMLTASYGQLEKEELSARTGGAMTARSLLYLLLRHSLLSEYARCAHRIQVAEEGSPVEIARDAALVDITEPKAPTLVRALDYDFQPHGVLRDCIHGLGAQEHPEAARLDEVHSHFSHLASLPSARLRWLLPEALDLASHRLDAWITAEASSVLTKLRRDNPEGLYPGAYGVLEDLRTGGPCPTQ